MIDDLPMKISRIDTALTPYTDNISEGVNIKRLVKKETEGLRTSVKRVRFVAKIVRPNIHQKVAVFLTRVK